MARHIEDEVAYYYDSYPTEEDLMGETSLHRYLIEYLSQVLHWLFRGQVCAIYANLNFYQTSNKYEYPLAPDIALIKGSNFRHVKSWRIGKSGPAPQVVFEIASEKTWDTDLEEKPGKYARMGVHEYFAYDPNEPLISGTSSQRLFGWQLDPVTHTMRELPAGSGGRIWSTELDSFLVPDGEYLRLYDRYGHLRLTEAEAEAQAKQVEAERANAEARAREALIKKLRSLGIDPDQL